jgi:hypothetical protein
MLNKKTVHIYNFNKKHAWIDIFNYTYAISFLVMLKLKMIVEISKWARHSEDISLLPKSWQSLATSAKEGKGSNVQSFSNKYGDLLCWTLVEII